MIKPTFRTKLSNAILMALDVCQEGFAEFSEFYENPRRYVWYGPSDFKKQALSSAILRLKNKGLIEKNFEEGKVILKLTNAGRDWLLKRGPEDNFKWDGYWRIVTFDIPESHRKVRDVLRNRLKSWGFVSWQKSVWASKKPLTDDLRVLVKDLGIEKWVLVIESKNVGRD
jgi:phenylacetic acid degradation operon negative regulatory protein